VLLIWKGGEFEGEYTSSIVEKQR